MKRFLYLTALVLICVQSNAQNENELYDEPVVIYNRQFYAGLHLHSNGYGAFMNFGKYRGVKKVMLYGFDLVFMKHEKETKSWNQWYQEARPYIYGKSNNFYIFRPTIGRKKIITEKLRKSGVQVGYTWQFGPTLGFTKPVYLEIGYPEGPIYEYLVEEKFDPAKHYSDNIFGKASSLKGLNEMKLHPGASFKLGLSFEYSNIKDRLKGLEVGFAADVFTEKIPIMSEEVLTGSAAQAQNHQFFFNFYINIFFGKKYNSI